MGRPRPSGDESVLRVNFGRRPGRPYHDVQMFYEGEVAERLAASFRARWGGGWRRPDRAPSLGRNYPFDLRASVDVHTPQVAIARTVSRTGGDRASHVEIHALYTDAIAAAEGLIYIETQYLTSRASAKRSKPECPNRARSKLQIVIVLPKHAEALKEEVALGEANECLCSLAETARRTGHALGVYYTVAAGGEDRHLHSFQAAGDRRSLHDRGLGELHRPQPLAGSRAQLGLGVDAGRGRGVCQHSRFAGERFCPSIAVKQLEDRGHSKSTTVWSSGSTGLPRQPRMSAHPSARINRATRARVAQLHRGAGRGLDPDFTTDALGVAVGWRSISPGL